jgi:hypothetical protein
MKYFEYLPKDINLIIFDQLFYDVMFNIEPYLELLDINLDDYLKYKLNSNILYNTTTLLDDNQKIALLFYVKYFTTLKSDIENISIHSTIYLKFLKDLYRDLKLNYQELTDSIPAKLILYDCTMLTQYNVKKWAIKTMLYYSIHHYKQLNIRFSHYGISSNYIKYIKEVKFSKLCLHIILKSYAFQNH